jgi:hypothetical protein
MRTSAEGGRGEGLSAAINCSIWATTFLGER